MDTLQVRHPVLRLDIELSVQGLIGGEKLLSPLLILVPMLDGDIVDITRSVLKKLHEGGNFVGIFFSFSSSFSALLLCNAFHFLPKSVYECVRFLEREE